MCQVLGKLNIRLDYKLFYSLMDHFVTGTSTVGNFSVENWDIIINFLFVFLIIFVAVEQSGDYNQCCHYLFASVLPPQAGLVHDMMGGITPCWLSGWFLSRIK